MLRKKRAEKLKEQTELGIFSLGFENIRVFAVRASSGGEFDLMPIDDGLPFISIGLNADMWSIVLSWTLHESFEFMCARQGHRYVHSGKFNGDAAAYEFHFDHSEFGEMCSKQAIFLAQLAPKLFKLWCQSQAQERADMIKARKRKGKR